MTNKDNKDRSAAAGLGTTAGTTVAEAHRCASRSRRSRLWNLQGRQEKEGKVGDLRLSQEGVQSPFCGISKIDEKL